MTTDISSLGSRLRIAYLSLLAAAGCATPGATADDQRPADATPEVKPAEPAKVDATAPKPEPEQPPVVAKLEPPKPESKPEPEQPVVAKPEPPKPEPTELPSLDRPSCPSGTWVTTAEEARKSAALGTATRLGCPEDVIAGAAGSAAAGDNRPPVHARVHLDEAATQALGKDQCSYTWVIPCPGGRPLLTDDVPLRADVAPGTAWLVELAPTRAIPEALRAAIVEGWLLDARSEHASVASFARATLELMALAAPPALVAETQRASLDEIEHAKLCFALASRCGGVALGPGPLPAVATRPADLVRLACDTFVEGCVGETIAALAAARAVRGCDDPAVGDALARIADDEARHAALAWATVGWALEHGGDRVRSALRALADRLRAEALGAETPAADPSAAALARHGRLDAAAQHACVVDAWQHLIPDALTDLLGDSPIAATS